MTHVEGGGVAVGTQLNGIYEIDKRIAMGGMGEVYIGHVIQTGDKVAIKMILPEHANNELILDLFRKEASTLHNLYHEAIVRYYVFSVDPALNRPYLAMEYAEGAGLGDRVRTHPMSEAEMSVLLPRIAGGLHAAHKAGIVHRDLSPDNIILVGGDVNRAKIIDFGIAKSSSSEGTLIGSGFAGKLKYVSPEQLGLGSGEVTARSDIYSLGLVLAEAVSGHPLDMGGSQVEVIEKRRDVPDLSTVPEYVRPLINWMLQPDPANRPASMEVVANWTPSTPTPVSYTAPAPTGDATQIAPAGLTAPPAASAPPPAEQAPARESRKRKRRRRGPLPALSLIFSGAVVAGIVAAVVVISQPDPELPDGTGTGGTGTSGTDAAGTNGDGNGGTTAADGGDLTRPPTDETAKDGGDGGDGAVATDGTGKTDSAPDTGDAATAGNGSDGGTGFVGLRDGGTGDQTPAAGEGTATTDGGAPDSGGGQTGGDSATAGTGAGSGDGATGGTETAASDAATSEPPKPGTPGTLLTPPREGGGGGDGSGLQVGGGGSSGVNTGTGPGQLAAGDGGAGGAVSAPTSGEAPRLPGGDTPALIAPDASGGSSPTVSDGGTTGAPEPGKTSAPSLVGGGATGGPSLAKTPVDASDGDPADSLAEPSVARAGPGQLSPGGDTDLAGAPKTGGQLTPGGRLAPTSPGSLDSGAATGGGGGLVPVPTDGAASPRPGGVGTPTLTTPGAGDSGPAPAVTGGSGNTPGLAEPRIPSLTDGGAVSDPSLAKAPVSAEEKDPVATLSEPSVATSSPGGLSAPTAPGEGSTLSAGGGGDDTALPRTGGSSPTPSTPGTPGADNTKLAAVAAPKDQPPTIRSRAPDSLSANQGQPLDMRLGEFFDEDGAVNLRLKIQGDVPNGLTIEMVEGGIARMSGTPTEYGDYTIKVAAIDSAGLISESITVALKVERPLENRDLRDYVLAYQGGDCFLSRPLDLTQKKPLIEVFLSEAGIPAVYKFDEDFKKQNGVEANIRARLISADQCELVHVLDRVGPLALDNSLVIRMIRDQLVAGDTLAGKIQGGHGARLFLFDNLASVTDLSGFVTERSGETGFSVPISGGKGPQILIAARPRDGSGVAPDASLNQLLAAAQQGKASLALGFFILK